jgi:hypothetical protein
MDFGMTIRRKTAMSVIKRATNVSGMA